MLSPLQEQVAEIIAGLEEAEGFALAGGAALIARGDVRRQTHDLDFFGLTADASSCRYAEEDWVVLVPPSCGRAEISASVASVSAQVG